VRYWIGYYYSDMPDGRKRPYHSPVREEAARRTRALLRDTARRLFVGQGYAPTTMKQIATEAGVAERTLYLAFPTKASLLQELIGVALAGGDDGPRADAADHRRAVSELGAAGAVARFAAHTTDLYERAGELLQLGEHAAESDPELRAFADAGGEATVRVVRTLVDGLADAGTLRGDLDARSATDVAWAISHFSSHQLLRKRRRWGRARYQRWLTDTLTRELMEAP
jgi:AcrR family transcriptional regulator